MIVCGRLTLVNNRVAELYQHLHRASASDIHVDSQGQKLEIRGMRNIGVPAELARLLPEFRETTGCGDWLATRGHLNRRDCAVYFLGSTQYRIPKVVIKVWRNNPAKNRARDIHKKSLKYYHAATGRFTIPEPLFPFSGGDALAMECIDAPLCGTLLAKGFHRRVTRETVIRNAGGWLAWFHEQKGISNAPFDGSTTFRKIAETVEKIRHHDSARAVRVSWLLDHLKMAECCARATDGLMLPHAVWHGDFTPFNLFMRGDSVTGFDFQVKRRHPVTHDICRFLLYLDVHRIFPASAGELRSSGCRERDREIFMQAYGREVVPEENLWLKLYFLELMRRIASLTLARAKGRTRPFRMQEMVRLRRNAKHISGAIS